MRFQRLVLSLVALLAVPSTTHASDEPPQAGGEQPNQDEINAQLNAMIQEYVQEHIMKPSVTVYDGPTECTDEEKVKNGDYVSMHYTAKIDESTSKEEVDEKVIGKVYSSSRESSKPIKFIVGDGRVVPGLDIGLVGLCKGSKSTLIIHHAIGYGEEGLEGLVPPNAILNFDVEILDVSDPPPIPNYFAMIDKNEDGFLNEEELVEYFKLIGFEDGSIPEEFWESNDENGDKMVSWDEFKGPKGEEEKEKTESEKEPETADVVTE